MVCDLPLAEGIVEACSERQGLFHTDLTQKSSCFGGEEKALWFKKKGLCVQVHALAFLTAACPEHVLEGGRSQQLILEMR